MGALWHVILKEFLQLRQDRKMVPVLFVGPVIQLVAFGYAVNMDVTRVPTVVVDEDRSPSSRALVERFTSSRYFERVGSEDTAAAVEPWLVDGRARIALVVGAGYGDAVAGGRRANVQVIADGTDSNSAVVGLGYASRILSAVGAELVVERTSRLLRPDVRPAAVELRPRILYNPELRSRWFYVPAVLAMVLMLVTLMLPSMAVVREKEIGTLEQIIVTPLRSWQLIVGKLLPFLAIGLVDTVLVTLVARFLFGVPLRGSLALLLALTLPFLINTLGLGLLLSTIVSTQQQAMMASVFSLIVPMIYLSGLIFPVENMPPLFQWVSYLIPVRYYANIIRGIFLKGSGPSVLWPDAAVLAAMGTVVLTLASLRFRKTLD